MIDVQMLQFSLFLLNHPVQSFSSKQGLYHLIGANGSKCLYRKCKVPPVLMMPKPVQPGHWKLLRRLQVDLFWEKLRRYDHARNFPLFHVYMFITVCYVDSKHSSGLHRGLVTGKCCAQGATTKLNS